MSTRFNVYINRILQSEGGYSNDRHDPGNWTEGVVGGGILKGTKYGISAASYPGLDIVNLTKEQAIDIYHADFWTHIHGDTLPEAVAFGVLDGAVNSGVSRSVAWLQRAAGVLGDGVWGPQTSAAVSVANPVQLLLRYTAYRLKFMTTAGGWKYYSAGWANRISTNLIFASDDIK